MSTWEEMNTANMEMSRRNIKEGKIIANTEKTRIGLSTLRAVTFRGVPRRHTAAEQPHLAASAAEQARPGGVSPGSSLEAIVAIENSTTAAEQQPKFTFVIYTLPAQLLDRTPIIGNLPQAKRVSDL